MQVVGYIEKEKEEAIVGEMEARLGRFTGGQSILAAQSISINPQKY